MNIFGIYDTIVDYEKREADVSMKVLMIPSWYPTPEAPLLGTFYKEQAEALAEKGIDIAVIHVNVSGDFNPKHWGLRREQMNGVLTYTYTRPNLTPGWEKGRCYQRTHMLERAYRRLVKEWGVPDVVNLRSSLHGYEAVSLCNHHALPLFFMEHSSFVITEDAESPMLSRLKTVMDKAAVNACVSSALYEVMHPIGKTRIIPDAVDTDRFVPQTAPAHSEFRFRAMGQLRPIKGYDMLIRAFAQLLKEEGCESAQPISATLEIAGVGGLKESLQALINDLHIGEYCRLVGSIPRDKAVEFMNGSDCFICSSRVETLSCVLNEAASCGKPLISTACGGPRDIVTEKIGLLTPVDDEQGMTKAMRQMLRTASQYSSEEIREQTKQRFGRETVCRLLIEACEDAVK